MSGRAYLSKDICALTPVIFEHFTSVTYDGPLFTVCWLVWYVSDTVSMFLTCFHKHCKQVLFVTDTTVALEAD